MSKPSQGNYLYWQHCRKHRTLDDLARETGLTRYQVHEAVTAYRYSIGEVVISERKLRWYRRMGYSIRTIAELELCSVGVICKKLHKLHGQQV